MSRNNILDVMRKILKLLSDHKEYPINYISRQLKIKWETTLKALEFLKEVGLVKEKKGKKAFREERLFHLK